MTCVELSGGANSYAKDDEEERNEDHHTTYASAIASPPTMAYSHRWPITGASAL